MRNQQKQSGLAWHVHHDKLVEYCWDYDERLAFIEKHKPKNEVATRKRLFQFIKGKLPDDLIEARKAYDEAWKAYDEARKAWDEAIEKHKDYLEELHANECPDCPWDGKEIVFTKG